MPVRTGQQYIEGLRRQHRDVWIEGQKVDDVTGHPAFKRGIESIAELYDLQHRSETRESLTYPSPTTGEPVSVSFLQCRSVDDLRRRHEATTIYASTSGGMLGRMPDFLNAVLTGFAEAYDFFAQGGKRYADNVVRYYEYVREHDLCLTHALVEPQINRAQSPADWDDPYLALRKVRETEDGIVVRGAKMLATLAPFSDEVIVYPLHRLSEKEKDYALSFAIPLSTPGITIICREGYDTGRRHFDRPLTSRFDEVDALVVFDDVLVPWERVFINANVELCNNIRSRAGLLDYAAFQAETRTVSKFEFVLGVACLIAEAIGAEGFLHVQEKLGELVGYTEMLRGLVKAAYLDPVESPYGYVHPNMKPLRAATLLVPKAYPRMVEVLELIGASGLVMTPTEADLESEQIGPLVRRYFQGRAASAEERTALFKLAWDIVGEAFGSRQRLYERFYVGDPVRLSAIAYLTYDKEPIKERVRRFLNMNRAAGSSGR